MGEVDESPQEPGGERLGSGEAGTRCRARAPEEPRDVLHVQTRPAADLRDAGQDAPRFLLPRSFSKECEQKAAVGRAREPAGLALEKALDVLFATERVAAGVG